MGGKYGTQGKTMDNRVLVVNLKEGVHLEEQEVNGRLLNCTFNKYDRMARIRFTSLRIDTSGRILLTQ
jgi:hypothetical protein